MALALPHPVVTDPDGSLSAEALQRNLDALALSTPAQSNGKVTLTAGTATVSTPAVTAASRIFLTVQSLGTVTTPKPVAVTARTAGASFTITSADATDTSVVAWQIVDPA